MPDMTSAPTDSQPVHDSPAQRGTGFFAPLRGQSRQSRSGRLRTTCHRISPFAGLTGGSVGAVAAAGMQQQVTAVAGSTAPSADVPHPRIPGGDPACLRPTMGLVNAAVEHHQPYQHRAPWHDCPSSAQWPGHFQAGSVSLHSSSSSTDSDVDFTMPVAAEAAAAAAARFAGINNMEPCQQPQLLLQSCRPHLPATTVDLVPAPQSEPPVAHGRLFPAPSVSSSPAMSGLACTAEVASVGSGQLQVLAHHLPQTIQQLDNDINAINSELQHLLCLQAQWQHTRLQQQQVIPSSSAAAAAFTSPVSPPAAAPLAAPQLLQQGVQMPAAAAAVTAAHLYPVFEAGSSSSAQPMFAYQEVLTPQLQLVQVSPSVVVAPAGNTRVCLG